MIILNEHKGEEKYEKEQLRGDFLQNHALFAQNQSDRTD